jgi:hypothetical protein
MTRFRQQIGQTPLCSARQLRNSAGKVQGRKEVDAALCGFYQLSVSAKEAHLTYRSGRLLVTQHQDVKQISVKKDLVAYS